MKRVYWKIAATMVASLVVLFPALVCAASDPAPPVGTPLVREGTFAVSLAAALGLGSGLDEITAESRLGELGISPRNGWIADYPVTPDIIGEMQQSVIAAADSSRLKLGRDEALKRFYDVNMEFGLSVVPYADESVRESSSEEYPAPATVNNYYYNYGPPVVTYYAPPPGYVYLYAWVPFPFWSWGFWFPGFYVLHDFHRTVIIDRRIVYVSNHYRDVRHNRVYVVDPVRRFHHSGKVYGIGVPRHKTIVYKPNPRVTRQVLDINHDRMRLRADRGPLSPAPGRNTPAVRPAQPVPRAVDKAPGSHKNVRDQNREREMKGRKSVARPEGNGNRRMGQEGRAPAPAGAARNEKERQVKPMPKSLDPRPVPAGKVAGPPKADRPQSVRKDAGQAPGPPVMNRVPPQKENRSVTRAQPQRSDAPRGREGQVGQQGRPPGYDRREMPSNAGPRRGERGGRG